MTTMVARLERAMRQRGWDQRRLAAEVEATQGAISKILVGTTANSRLMPRIATRLGVDLAWLLEGADDVEEKFTAEERDWVDLYRSMSADDRATMKNLARSLTRYTPVPTMHSPASAYRGSGK